MLPIRSANFEPEIFEIIAKDPACRFAHNLTNTDDKISKLSFITFVEREELCKEHPESLTTLPEEFYFSLDNYSPLWKMIYSLTKRPGNQIGYDHVGLCNANILARKVISTFDTTIEVQARGWNFDMQGAKTKEVYVSARYPELDDDRWLVLQASSSCQYRVLIGSTSLYLHKFRNVESNDTLPKYETVDILFQKRFNKPAYEGLLKLFSGVFHTSLSEEERAALRLEKDFD